MESPILLRGGETLITHDKEDAWHLVAGQLYIYVVPLLDNTAGRRAFLYTASPGDVIPALSYQDYEYTNWRFCLVPVDQAKVNRIEGGNTKILANRFARKAKLAGVELEGFAPAAVNHYKLTLVAEDGLIHKTGKEKKAAASNTLALIYNFFSKKQIEIKTKLSGQPLYDAVAKICEKAGITLAPLEKLQEACPSGFGLSDIARISHFAYRELVLDEDWYRSDAGFMLAYDQDGNPVALLPKGQNAYLAVFSDKQLTVNAALAARIDPQAYAIYRPLPNKPIEVRDLISFSLKSVKLADLIQIVLLTALVSGVGLLLPLINQLLYDNMIPLGAKTGVLQLGYVIGSAMLGNVFFNIAQNILQLRVSSRVNADIECAIQDRLFNLPVRVIRRYETADLAQRFAGLSALAASASDFVLTTGQGLILSLVYFVRMVRFSSVLAWTGILLISLYTFVVLLFNWWQSKYQTQIQATEGKAAAALYQQINGIAKIRMAGAEERALYEYMKLFIQKRQLDKKRHTISNSSTAVAGSISALFSVVFYWLLIKGDTNVSIGEFIAFSAAFGLFSGAFTQVITSLASLRMFKPVYERVKPILREKPEFSEMNELPGELSGEIELNSVNFAYSPDSPDVLQNFSLRINPGEYIGIVGPSGCGKSTLLKLLLGFEVPTRGTIYYDKKDIDSLDKRELRKKLGVVLQDGKLISGSIFDNITITAPQSSLSDVEQIVREVGLEKDLAEMPMGLHTVLSEDAATISGGQQQRILIARALASRPKIIFFDEATSALDNVTQAMVSESLEKMQATRLIIAHRLSTIINCDRIIVMNNGRIEEEGTYQELMAARGLFYDLASRQLS